MSTYSIVNTFYDKVKESYDNAQALRRLQLACLNKPFPEDEVLNFVGINFVYFCINLLKALINLHITIASLFLILFALDGGMKALKMAWEIFILQIYIILLNLANAALAFVSMFTRSFATLEIVENKNQAFNDMEFNLRENETGYEAGSRVVKSIVTIVSQEIISAVRNELLPDDNEQIYNLTIKQL